MFYNVGGMGTNYVVDSDNSLSLYCKRKELVNETNSTRPSKIFVVTRNSLQKSLCQKV